MTWAGIAAAGIGAVGSIGAAYIGNQGSGGGGSGGMMTQEMFDSLPDTIRDYYKYQTSMASDNAGQSALGLDWTKFYEPEMKKVGGILSPLIQQRLSQPGLPPELDQQIWNLARNRLATGYNSLGTQLGEQAAGRGQLNSGATGQSWMDRVGLAQNTALNDMATQRAALNYDAMNQAIGQAQTFIGQNPVSYAGTAMLSPYGGSTSTEGKSTDYSGLGALFAQGASGLSNIWGRSPGIQGGVGGTTSTNAQFGQVWSPYTG